MGGSTSVAAPAPAPTAGAAEQSILSVAPQEFQAASTYGPQYSDLYNQMAQSSLFGDSTTQGLLTTLGQATPQLQSIQSSANTQSAAANIGLVQQYGSSATAAYQAANPQLAALQQQYTQMATNPQNPVSQIQGTQTQAGQISQPDWAPGFANQVGSTLAASAVNPTTVQGANLGFQVQGPQQVGVGQNSTLNQLNQTAQQQLAMGTSVTPQEQAQVANSVLSNYNQMGRANDPTAIAGLALGEDSYGQSLLNQREANASTAAGQMTTQQGLGLSAQQSNQAAQLQTQNLGLSAATTQAGLTQQANLANQSTNLAGQQSNLASQVAGLGLVGSADQASYAQQLAAAQSNQSAALTSSLANQSNAYQVGTANQSAQSANAQYQSALMSGAGSLLTNTSVDPYSVLLGQSGALGAAGSAAGSATGSASASQSLMNEYNPFSNGAFSTIYGGNLQANQSTASNNAAVTGGAISAAGNVVGSL